MTSYKFILLIIVIFVAIGTVAVAILAIWGDKIKLKLGLGPKLKLSLADPNGEFINITSDDGATIPCRYYHLRVSNTNRWSPATNVRVVITGISNPAADNRYVSQPMDAPLHLMWSLSAFLDTTVGPDRFCNLGYLVKGEKFYLTPYVYPNDFPDTLGPNQKMMIETKVIADNAQSQPIIIEVSWDGGWEEDTMKMANHLVVKEVKKKEVLGFRED
jgi:hypothetical protein